MKYARLTKVEVVDFNFFFRAATMPNTMQPPPGMMQGPPPGVAPFGGPPPQFGGPPPFGYPPPGFQHGFPGGNFNGMPPVGGPPAWGMPPQAIMQQVTSTVTYTSNEMRNHDARVFCIHLCYP